MQCRLCRKVSEYKNKLKMLRALFDTVLDEVYVYLNLLRSCWPLSSSKIKKVFFQLFLIVSVRQFSPSIFY